MKAILTKCIESLVQLKTQIRKIVTFFEAMSELISYVEQYHVQPFLDLINNIDSDVRHIAGFKYSDLQRQVRIIFFSLPLHSY